MLPDKTKLIDLTEKRALDPLDVQRRRNQKNKKRNTQKKRRLAQEHFIYIFNGRIYLIPAAFLRQKGRRHYRHRRQKHRRHNRRRGILPPGLIIWRRH